MKYAFFIFFLATSFGFAVSPPQVIKSSNEKKFDAPAEVKAFYLKLLETDAAVKRRFDALAKQAVPDSDDLIGPEEPQAIEWYPCSKEASAGKNFHYDLRFLVIQRIAFGGHKWYEVNSAIVSEFRVVHEGTTQIDPKDLDEKQQLVSNKITVQFLGFRTLSLTSKKGADSNQKK